MDPPQLSVLFIDDERTLCDYFLHMAERSHELKMQAAQSASDGLRILENTPFDAIVVDYEMPEINGIQFLKILRSRGDTTPVIVFTAAGREHTAIEALNNGANFYLKKSDDARMQFREIVSMVNTAVERSYLGKPVGTSQRIIADMISLTSDPGFAIDSKGVVIAWNESMEQLTEIPAESIVGKGDLEYAESLLGTKRKTLLDLVFESDEELGRQKYMLVKRVHKGPVIAVTRGIKPDGTDCTIWTKAMPLYDARGSFIAVGGILRDVTTTFSDVTLHDGSPVDQPKSPALAGEPQKPGVGILNRILGRIPVEYREGVRLMMTEQKYAEAIAMFDLALKNDEKFAQAWNDRGVCYRELNDYTNALKSCLRAVELDAENLEFLFTLGETLQRIGVIHMSNKHLESAIQIFTMVINQRPNCFDAWNNLGVCYLEIRKDKEAKFRFERAQEIRMWKKDTPIVSRRNDYL